MKLTHAKLAALALAALAAPGALAQAAAQPAAQSQARPAADDKKKQQRPRTAPATAGQPAERLEPDDRGSTRTDVPAETVAARHENLAEEEALANAYVNNFMTTYRLGPEDVISITVFGPHQDRYSKAGIVIPPHAIITHQLIPEGVFVGGKTTEQVQEEIRRKLDEYIVDPKVTVTIDRAQSAVFWVVGDVAQPGVRPMTRRLSVLEAVALSGGVLDTGNKKKVVVQRRLPNGYLQAYQIDLAAIERGRQPDNFYLQPGDHVMVPGNRLKSIKKWVDLISTASLFRIFTGGW
jgi:polysaccharide biosynthesis/export protein